jgi:hypothetical protein
MEAKCDKLDDNAQFERGDEEDETVTAQRLAASCCAFSICICESFAAARTFAAFSNGQCVLRSECHPHLFKYSPSTPLVYGSNLRPLSFTAYAQRTGEEAVKEEEPSMLRGDNRVDRYGRAVFMLGWQGPNKE